MYIISRIQIVTNYFYFIAIIIVIIVSKYRNKYIYNIFNITYIFAILFINDFYNLNNKKL